MDEMDMLKDVLAMPEPSSDTVRKGRRELEQLVRAQPRTRTRRPRWRVAGIGLTAAAVAVAVTATVILTSGTPTRPGAAGHSTTGRHHPAAAKHGAGRRGKKQSVQQILLTAAASAARAPARSGTYWYLRIRSATGNGNKLYLVEMWIKRDDQQWIRDRKTGHKVIELPRLPGMLGPFFLGGREMTVRQIQHLPTDPTALTRWIVTNAARHGGKTGGPAPSKSREREDIFESLVSLLSELPATPQLRAAAFRALAALPGVTSLGQVGGGQGVRFTVLGGQRATLIIDPATGEIRATNFYVDNQGGEFMQPVPNATITGRWTNNLP